MRRLIQTINNNFIHTPLGILTFDIDISKFSDMETFSQNYYQSYFVITDSSGNILYQSDSSGDFSALSLVTDNRYQTFNNSSYFVTKARSEAAQWNYCLLIPKKEILGSLIAITKTLAAAYTLLIFVYIAICFHLSDKITRPLSLLSREMDTVASGNFEIAAQQLLSYTANDELRTMCQHFISMTEQLNTLITENYKVRLLNKDAQLKALQAQMDPHFLYNTLDSVNWLAKLAKQPQISTIVQSLAALMRQTLDTSRTEYLLKDELQLLENYLAIQQIRYGSRLQFTKIIDNALMNITVPKLILQPFLENSIRYALENMKNICEITLEITSENALCKICITDNGPGIPKEMIDLIFSGQIKPKGNGIGIKNVNDRLKLLYPLSEPMRITAPPEGGTCITLLLPQK